MNRLEEEARIGKAGTLASQLSRLDVVVLDELGYLPFARSGGQASWPMTNVRNLELPQWRRLAERPQNRCLVPLTEFC